MWLVSCRRKGMLTQGPTPYPKWKLKIPSFLTLPCPLDCLICAKDIMIIVLLIHMMGGDGNVRSWFIYVRVWVGWQGVGVIVFLFCSVFLLLLILLSCLVDDRCCVCFSVSFLLSLILVPLIVASAWKILCLFFETIFSQVLDHWSVDFREKGRLRWFRSLFRESTLFYISELNF